MFGLSTGIFVVGFVERMYTVTEGDGHVQVCVMREISVMNWFLLRLSDPGSIAADAARASKLALLLRLE